MIESCHDCVWAFWFSLVILLFDNVLFCVAAHAKARLPANKDFASGLYLVSTGAHDLVNMFNQNFTTDHMESKFGKLMTLYGLAVRVSLSATSQLVLLLLCGC